MKRGKYTRTKNHRTAMSKRFKGRLVTWGNKISKSSMGKVASKEARMNMSKSQLGRKHSTATKLKMRLSRLGVSYGPCTQERKDALSKALKGRKFTKAHKTRIKNALKGIKKTNGHRERLSLAIAQSMVGGALKHEHPLIRGKFYSEKSKKDFYYKSELELNWYIKLEKDVNVVAFDVEPFYIPYKWNGIRRCYVPDLLVSYKSGLSVILEIKKSDRMTGPRERAQYSAARGWCRKHQGFSFVVSS